MCFSRIYLHFYIVNDKWKELNEEDDMKIWNRLTANDRKGQVDSI
jgi:hypothetical protein